MRYCDCVIFRAKDVLKASILHDQTYRVKTDGGQIKCLRQCNVNVQDLQTLF